VEQADPFAGIAAAISREDPAGQPVGGWQPQERVDRASALAGYSSGAAWAGFAEQRFGRPAPGQRADFVFVDTDPMFASAAEIRPGPRDVDWRRQGLERRSGRRQQRYRKALNHAELSLMISRNARRGAVFRILSQATPGERWMWVF
jgi:hypothetical protein